MSTRRLFRVGQVLLAGLLLAGAALAKSDTEWYDDGMGYLGEKKYAEAEAAFKESVKADPRYKEAWQALADVFKLEGKTALAAAAQGVADRTDAVRAGDAPPLTDEQRRIVEERLEGTPAPAPQGGGAQIGNVPTIFGGGAPAPAAPAAPAAQAEPVAAPPAPIAATTAPEPPRPLPALTARDANGRPKPMAKLSKYDKAEYADALATGGLLHAVYTDQPDATKPHYLYYRASSDGGAHWSEAKNLSDDESDTAASWCRLMTDGQGRVYALWKYVGKNELLDGPGGNGAGILAYRCLQGGAWSRITKLTAPKVPAYSWFAANGPDGSVQVVWSQMAPDGLAVQGWGSAQYADLVQQVGLDGATPGAPRVLVGPKPLPTKEQIDAAQAAGHSIPYAEQRPKKDGLWNLRGYVDRAGVTHFVAEDPGIEAGPNATGNRILLFDGTKLQPLYAYERYKTFNNFNNPPTLLLDTQGKEHLIRAPEKAEVACVRDYPLEDGQLGDPIDLVAAPDGKGTITNWQARALPGGRMVVTTSLSRKGGYAPDDLELYVSFSDGGGQWTAPLCVTDNQARQKGTFRETSATSSVATSSTYFPRYAAVTVDRDGHPGLIMVNAEHTIVGVSHTGALGGTYGGNTESPMVFYLRL